MSTPKTSGALDLPVLALSLTLLLALWVVAAWATADASIMPQPIEVWRIAAREFLDGPMLHHILATLRRVAFAFALSMAFGVAVGAALGLSPAADRWFGPWVTVFQNIPALVVIVLCYLWLGLNDLAAILAVSVNKTAMVAVTVREGVRSADAGLTELSRAYRLPLRQRVLDVWLPQLWPFLAAAMRNGLAIIWKLVLVVEFLGRSDGVGFQIHLYFQLFETGYVLAYALSFVAVMLAIEYGLFRPAELRAGAWRRRTAAFS